MENHAFAYFNVSIYSCWDCHCGKVLFTDQRPKSEGQRGESGVGAVKAGINRVASLRDKMPKNHDNVNIPDLRCHVVPFPWQI